MTPNPMNAQGSSPFNVGLSPAQGSSPLNPGHPTVFQYNNVPMDASSAFSHSYR